MELRDFRGERSKERWACPFPPFSLSETEKMQLKELAQTIVDTNIVELEQYWFENNRKLVPERDWKFLRRDSQVETFLRRRDKYGLNGFGTKKRFRNEADASGPVSRSNSDEITSMDVVDIRTIGATNGTMEDALYGLLNPTTIIMRIKSAYIDDGIQDCNVFNVIQNSTPDDPFSTLSIRWRVTENAPVVNWVVKSYDHVYLDATGYTTLSNGERVAFQLLHSIDFPTATPLVQQFSRGQSAAIVYFRQLDNETVGIWARGVFTVPMERTRALFAPVIASVVSKSCINIFHAAQMKKLRWAVYRRQHEQRSGKGSMPRTSSASPGGEKMCIVCNKQRRLRTGDSCDLCGEHVCGPCGIAHKVAYVDDDNKLRWHKVRVCSFCMAKVVKMDAREAIAIELAAGHFNRIN